MKNETDYVITLDNYADKILEYVNSKNLIYVNVDELLSKIRSGLANNMDSSELARYCAETAGSMITKHQDYGSLAAMLLIGYHNSITLSTFSGKIAELYENGKVVHEDFYKMVMRNKEKYDSMINYERDWELSYFSMQSLIKSYLLKCGNRVVERPQDAFMRVAVQLHGENFVKVKETYDFMSQGYFTHATPTMLNSCLNKPQLASCFLISMKDDSIEGVFQTLADCAIIAKYTGGLGLALHDIRSDGSPLCTMGGSSKGIIPLIKIINTAMNYLNNGTKKRSSSVALYLEPWHQDILQFLDLRKNTGPEDLRARDIFTALWINDLFMERVEANADWALFDPAVAPGLDKVWGDEFRELYEKYERTRSYIKIKAQDLWKSIIIAQIETGTPYIVYKDTVNRLSNQGHIGTIRSSNLCAEIVEYSDVSETAVCNLASIALPRFVKNGVFDFHELRRVVAIVTENLNNTIDKSFYPTKETRRSNFKHRPIGIGVQGLADVFAMLRYPFESSKARTLNKMIFETLYFAAVEASVNLAKKYGPHESFPGSKLSHGIFHWELTDIKPSGLWDWDTLRKDVVAHGTRNSLFIALMPTASTSQILGNNECFEPFTSNIYTRRTLAGEFQLVNKYLMEDLIRIGLWSNEMKNLIIEYDGSIQNIPGIPKELKDLYKISWELKMKTILDMAADRQAFVDQSQSLNIYMEQPTYKKLTSMHFYGWRRGLKTGMYYLRTKPITNPIKFTVDQSLLIKTLSSLQDFEFSDQNDQNTCQSCSC